MNKKTPELEHGIKKLIHQSRISENFRERLFYYTEYLPIPILIGLIAAYILYYFYGPKVLIQALLSWTIGITLVTTMVGSFLKSTNK